MVRRSARSAPEESETEPSDQSGNDEDSADEAGIVPGADGDTTDNEDDVQCGRRPAWAEEFTGVRRDKPVRGRSVQAQKAYIGRKVAQCWGGPEKYWIGEVTSIYNATSEFEEGGHPRDLYHVVWEQREDGDLDDDQIEDDFEHEELQAMLRTHDELVPRWTAERRAAERRNRIGRPAYVEMLQYELEYEEGESEHTSSRRKCTGGGYHISRPDYEAVANTSPSKPNSKKQRMSTKFIDSDSDMAEEAQPGRAGWLPGPIPRAHRELPEFKGPTPGPTGADGITKHSTAGEALRAAFPIEYLELMVDNAIFR